ncbi:MAG: carboxy terminal-processing peptidase [Xanthomonadales bacterium]|nr:carboxy terminal-processing peptidase [Xanthomonadales bacterium]
MKTKIALGLLLATMVATLQAKPDAAVTLQPGERQPFISGWIRHMLSTSQIHYSPRKLDDTLSSEIFDAYLKELDSDRVFFLASDIERFETYRTRLDDALSQGALEPPFEIFNVYVERVADRTAHARELLKGKFDFNTDEKYAYDRKDAPWAKTEAELDGLWDQRVKNDVLRLKLAGKDMDGIRDTLDRRYQNFEQRVREIDADDVFQTFINAYANAIEPHTAYMNARASENFNISMRLSLEGIGAVLQRDDETTVVRSIVPGGPAAISGKVKPGDRIVGVGQGRTGPVVDVIGWRIDDVVELIRGPKDTSVRLDVIPAEAGLDGPHEVVTLVRQKVKLEAQAAKKKVVELADGEGVRKIGIIELPTFYQDFEGRRRDEPDYRSASRDVAKLLAELKEEKVEGVLIDLRNNGGGSLTEATELTGLFIDTGPVVQVRDQAQRVEVHRDFASGTAWDGPLAVLVNRASASASEIFAAAIQDYGRGIVIGEQTFGKGTVQNLVDLDRFASREAPGLGQLRVTMAQFFRINGGSTQNKGVLPDVSFPVTLDASEYGESVFPNALPWTRIEPVKFHRVADFSPLLPLLQQRHDARVAKDQEFTWWSDDVAEYRRQRALGSISLNFDARKREREEAEAKRKARDEARAAMGLELAAAPLDDGLQADERAIDADEDDAAAERPDPLLREAAHVLVDAIDLLATDTKLAAQVYPERVGKTN